MEERLALWERRYSRPAPPVDLGIPPKVGAYKRSDYAASAYRDPRSSVVNRDGTHYVDAA
ncbi:hypothetical protein [Mycolicibacterium psychrotolerans]|nr:hypothetical protein [Mycolicibacterium psychrotolerans]